MTSPYSALAALVREGKPASLATLISSHPDGPKPGAKLLVLGDGSTTGSIHSDLDNQVAADARRLLLEERSEVIAYSTPSGSIEVFIQSFPPPQELIIVGAVHVAIPLAKLGKLLGYHITVVDPRSAFACRERFPEADRLLVDWPDEVFPTLNLNMSSYVVVLSHDPKLDLPALMSALNSDARYIGAIGSRATFAQRKADLTEMGATDDQLARIHSPIGLNIRARTPAEIAVAIMAEIVAVRRGAGPSPV